MECRLDTFHRQVRALHNADLDCRATACTTSGRPLLEAHHRGKRVRQVRLQHNAGFEILEFRAIEDLGEHLDGDVEVLEFLHVEVDEGRGRALGCELVEGQKSRDDVRHILVIRPRRVRRDRRRHLDRHVIDVGSGDECGCSRETLGRFALAEHCFTEQVDVESDAWLFQFADNGTEFGVGRIDDEVADHFAQHESRDGNDDAGQDGRERTTQSNSRAHEPGQEVGDFGSDLAQFPRSDA